MRPMYLCCLLAAAICFGSSTVAAAKDRDLRRLKPLAQNNPEYFQVAQVSGSEKQLLEAPDTVPPPVVQKPKLRPRAVPKVPYTEVKAKEYDDPSKLVQPIPEGSRGKFSPGPPVKPGLHKGPMLFDHATSYEYLVPGTGGFQRITIDLEVGRNKIGNSNRKIEFADAYPPGTYLYRADAAIGQHVSGGVTYFPMSFLGLGVDGSLGKFRSLAEGERKGEGDFLTTQTTVSGHVQLHLMPYHVFDPFAEVRYGHVRFDDTGREPGGTARYNFSQFDASAWSVGGGVRVGLFGRMQETNLHLKVNAGWGGWPMDNTIIVGRHDNGRHGWFAGAGIEFAPHTYKPPVYHSVDTVFMIEHDTTFIVQQCPGLDVRMVRYTFNGRFVPPSQKPDLDTLADNMMSDCGKTQILWALGKTDQVGDRRYNEILGLDRANSAVDYIVARNHMNRGRIRVYTLGKDFRIRDQKGWVGPKVNQALWEKFKMSDQDVIGSTDPGRDDRVVILIPSGGWTGTP